MKNNFMVIFFLCLLMSCLNKPFSESKKLGGVNISKDILNRGHSVYQAKCISCHGPNGDGAGITYRALLVRPRNLTQGIYKFGLSLNGGLPTDDDFRKILDHGLIGTAMIPWGLSEEDSFAVIQYIKTFASEVWEENAFVAPERPDFSKDPFVNFNKSEVVKKGEKIYHEAGQCYSCHRAYLSLSEMRKLTEDSSLTATSDIFQVKPQETEYFTGKDSSNYLISLPPDFGNQSVRTGSSVEELYQRISVGVNGTPMPGWRDVLSEEDIWAVSYYVHELIKKN